MENCARMICNKRAVPLCAMQKNIEYFGHSFHADALRCPNCRQVCLSEELIPGRISEVEYELEDK